MTYAGTLQCEFTLQDDREFWTIRKAQRLFSLTVPNH